MAVAALLPVAFSAERIRGREEQGLEERVGKYCRLSGPGLQAHMRCVQRVGQETARAPRKCCAGPFGVLHTTPPGCLREAERFLARLKTQLKAFGAEVGG